MIERYDYPGTSLGSNFECGRPHGVDSLRIIRNRPPQPYLPPVMNGLPPMGDCCNHQLCFDNKLTENIDGMANGAKHMPWRQHVLS